MVAREEIEQAAREMGFDWFGVAKAEALDAALADFRQWLAEGRQGTMQWMERDPGRRADPARVLPRCRSVLVLGMNYLLPDEAERRDPEPAGKVSRYARGRDYHRVFEKKLRRLAALIDQRGGEGTRSRSYVDYGPVLERQWAVKAGLGFAGKHTLLIHPNEGSYFFLGVVLTTAELTPSEHRLPPAGCGDCRQCIDACPTGAITGPWELDARRCLSYLTIEHKGAIDEDLWPYFEGWVYGCDICQDVCPYNRKRAKPAPEDRFAPRKTPAEWSLVDLLALTPGRLDSEFRGSPLRRAGAESMVRNAAIVASEKGGTDEAQLLETIAGDPGRPDWLRRTCSRALRKIKDRGPVPGET